MTGKKFDDGKPRYDLIPPVVLEQLATVLTFGAKKYGPNNWQTVPDAQNRYYSAMMRHVEADRGGEVFDEESGLPHLTHALACVTFLLHGRMVQPDAVQRPGCKVPPELEPLLEWLGPSHSIKFLDNADSLSTIVCVPPRDFINVAFTWDDSPEGRIFWAALDKDWRNHVVATDGLPMEHESTYTSRIKARAAMLNSKEDTSVVAGDELDELDELLDWLGPVNSSRYLLNMNPNRLVIAAKLPKIEQISRAFSWTRSNEDHIYWASVNEKWLAHLREEKAPEAPTLKSLDDLYLMAEFFKWLGPVNESRYLEYTTTRRLKSIIKTPYSYLTGAFVWITAPEGNKYWCDLNFKWLDHLAKKNKQVTQASLSEDIGMSPDDEA